MGLKRTPVALRRQHVRRDPRDRGDGAYWPARGLEELFRPLERSVAHPKTWRRASWDISSLVISMGVGRSWAFSHNQFRNDGLSPTAGIHAADR